MKTFTGLCWGLTITFLLMTAINFVAMPQAAAVTQMAG